MYRQPELLKGNHMEPTSTYLVATFTTETKDGDYTTPELIDLIEDLPTIANYAALHTGRLHLDDNGTIINTEPLPDLDKTAPNYTKLPTRDEFAVSTLTPLTQAHRYWVLVAHNSERYVVRIDFDADPLEGVSQTEDDFTLSKTPVGQTAKSLVDSMKNGSMPPESQPDAHDDWAYRLFIGLFQDSGSFEEENDEDE